MKLELTLPDEVLKNLYSGLEERIIQRLELLTKSRETIPNEKTNYLTRKEASNILKISLPTIHNWIKSGKLKINRIGRRILIDEADLKTFVNSLNTNE